MDERQKFQILLQKLSDANVTGLSGAVTYVNNYSLLKLLKSNADVLHEIAHVRVDGALLTMCLWPFTGRLLKRASFDMTSDARLLFEHANRKEAKIISIGGTRLENQLFVEKMSVAYPKAVWDGIDGFLETDEIVAEIKRNSDADFLIIGTGTPFQERLQYLVRDLKITTYTCGGFITQTSKSNSIDYYPKNFDRLNLRWLYRMSKERHVARRVFVDYPVSIFKLAKFFVGRL